MILIGERTSKKYEIGQKVKVIVARADERTHQIDFCLSRGR